MAPTRSHRRAVRPLYPGVVQVFALGMLGFMASLLGFRLPWHAAWPLRLGLEAVVVLLLWKAVSLFRASVKAQLRLFNAQSALAYAVALQAFILLLRH
ncbi:MAG TPA: hypothetical protein VF995_09840 [Actinomycetota bacterium]